MKLKLLVTAMLASGLISVPVHAEHHGAMHEKGKQMKAQAETTASEMKKKGKDKVEQARQAVEEGAAEASDAAEDAAESATEAAEDAVEGAQETAEQTTESVQESAADKVPPGMAKRDEHPSTGKGSEKGQAAREATEKPRYQFWE